MAFSILCGLTRLTLHSSDYYPLNIVHNNRNYMDTSFSTNGCVIQMSGVDNGAFAGGQHGYTRVIGANLIIDGNRIEFGDGGSYTGNYAIFGRTINYASGFVVDHVTTIKNGQIDDSFTAVCIDSGRIVSFFYGCLYAHSNRLKEYTAYANNGVIIQSGNSNLDDDSTPLFKPGVFQLKQRDTTSGDYIISTYRYDERLANMWTSIVDRSADNKVYNTFYGYHGTGNNKTFAWGKTLNIY